MFFLFFFAYVFVLKNVKLLNCLNAFVEMSKCRRDLSLEEEIDLLKRTIDFRQKGH